MSPRRGVDGKGVCAMKCSNCHQAENTPGIHTPSGNPNWHLPSANMRMVFQGKSPRQLAQQLIDPNSNGHKDMKKLIEHADDGLVTGERKFIKKRLPQIAGIGGTALCLGLYMSGGAEAKVIDPAQVGTGM